MVTQIEVINELTEFFKPAKVKINVIRQLHNTQWHDRQEIDMVLGETVAIEVKSDFAMRSVLEGVGQAILNL